MPLDVDDVIGDPDFLSPVTVFRRQETINSFGESTVTQTAFRIEASIKAGGGDLERMSDAQLMTKFITVHARFRFQGPSPGYQPDVLLWHGDNYVVRRLFDWSNYGLGYVKVVCESMDAMDQPPRPAVWGGVNGQ